MEMFPNSGLFELYGSTEAAWVTMLHPDEQFDHLGTVEQEVAGSLPIRPLDRKKRMIISGEGNKRQRKNQLLRYFRVVRLAQAL